MTRISDLERQVYNLTNQMIGIASKALTLDDFIPGAAEEVAD